MIDLIPKRTFFRHNNFTVRSSAIFFVLAEVKYNTCNDDNDNDNDGLPISYFKIKIDKFYTLEILINLTNMILYTYDRIL